MVFTSLKNNFFYYHEIKIKGQNGLQNANGTLIINSNLLNHRLLHFTIYQIARTLNL